MSRKSKARVVTPWPTSIKEYRVGDDRMMILLPRVELPSQVVCRWWTEIVGDDESLSTWTGRRVPSTVVYDAIRMWVEDRKEVMDPSRVTVPVMSQRCHNIMGVRAVKTRAGVPSGEKVRAMQFYDPEYHRHRLVDWILGNSRRVHD